MSKKNSVFIATSIDGYIADKSGGIDWLNTVPNPNQDDMGYVEFIKNIDALIMGRTTFETVCGFDVDWPCSKPVFVLSNKLKEIPQEYAEKAFLTNGTLQEILTIIHSKGYSRLYIDGGTTIRNFLKEDLIDEMVLTTIPVILGGGSSLFGELSEQMNFRLLKSRTYLNQVVQNHYQRTSSKRNANIRS